MKVILHVDRSDPVVAVSLNAHVGSSREVPGRTGFAHMFEHLFFLESENLGKGGLGAMTARIAPRRLRPHAGAQPRADVADFGTTYTPADHDVTKSALTKGRARAFETSNAKLDYLASVADFRLPIDYPRREQAVLDSLTVAQVQRLAARYLRPGAMTYVVVGDAAARRRSRSGSRRSGSAARS